MDFKVEMLKTKGVSRNLKIVINVIFWLAIIAVCGTLIAAIVIKLIPDSHFELSERNIQNTGFTLDGIIKYNLTEIASPGINMKNLYITIMIMAASILFLILPVLKQLVLILKSIEEDKPFSLENSKRIGSIGAVLMLSSFIIPSIEAFVASRIIDTLGIQNISTNYSVNIYLIFTGFMMFILSRIFRYGSYLQHEYDETV